MTNGKLIQESLRIIYCSSEGRFKQIFGTELGVKMWDMFRTKYPKNVAHFVCEMPGEAARLLGEYTIKELGSRVSTDGTAFIAMRTGELIDKVIAREKLSDESLADLGYVRIYANESKQKPAIDASTTMCPGNILGMDED